MTPTVTSSSSNFHFSSPYLLIFSQRKNSAFSQQETHLSCQLFWLCFPWSRKKIPATENPWTSGAQVWSLPHTYTNEIQTYFFLSVQPSPPTFASAAISLFVPTTPLPSPSMPTPNWISESVLEIKPSRSSDVLPPSIYSIVPTSLTLYTTLGPPLPQRPIRHPTSILPPILRQKWSPRAKLHRALTGITSANRFNYFGVTASRSSTQSSGGWDDVDPNPPVT